MCTCQSHRMFTGKRMEHLDKETELQRCVCESSKGQFRTKSVTHNQRRPEMVPVLFATLPC